MEPAKIVLRALAIFCGYGALFGLVCAWLCPEVYTLAKPRDFGDLPAPALGVLWGMFDLLTYAAAIGVGTAFAAHVGHRPTVKAFFFTWPMAWLAGLVGAVALVAGFLGRQAALSGNHQLDRVMAFALPPERHPIYIATWWALLASQAVMLLGGVFLAVWTWRKRAVFEQMVQAGEIRKTS